MGQGDNARQVFQQELALIRTDSIREFVVAVFEQFGTQDWWSRPCSLTGKYHPQLAQGSGGLVRHVKYGVYWAQELSRAHIGNGRKFTPEDQWLVDVITGSLILHDLMKDGDPELSREPERVGHRGKSLITGCHGVDLANAIWNRMLRGKGTPEQILILYGIAGHMGVWTIPAEYQPIRIQNEMARFVAQLVANADYAASRKADDYLLAAATPTQQRVA